MEVPRLWRLQKGMRQLHGFLDENNEPHLSRDNQHPAFTESKPQKHTLEKTTNTPVVVYDSQSV